MKRPVAVTSCATDAARRSIHLRLGIGFDNFDDAVTSLEAMHHAATGHIYNRLNF